jgi:hypothetical protein
MYCSMEQRVQSPRSSCLSFLSWRGSIEMSFAQFSTGQSRGRMLLRWRRSCVVTRS